VRFAVDRRIAAILSEGLFGRLAFGMVSFGFPLYALALGLPLIEIGILITIRSLVMLPAKPLVGMLTDRIGLRTVYRASGLVRVLGAAGLLVAGDAFGLAMVRVLQGVSAAARDVGSLGVIARDGERRVATIVGWYVTAKHIGGVAGAGLAGMIIAVSGGSFTPLFVIVLSLSAIPVVTAWWGIPADEPRRATPPGQDDREPASRECPDSIGGLRRLAGPATVGGIIAASASMVHGLFPILATEYAGLDTAEAGIVYSLSAGVMLVVGPLAGFLSDRFGPVVGLTWRPIANIGSSLLYLVAPGFGGFTAARLLDDSGKSAFRPAWAATAAGIAARDPARRGQRLGILDGGQSAGEAVGPLLATVLWQTGGVALLFAGRIVVAVAGELAAFHVFGEARLIREWVHRSRRRGEDARAPGVSTDGIPHHELRGHLTVARGEIELVLAKPEVPDRERARSVMNALAALDRATGLVSSATAGVKTGKTAVPERSPGPEPRPGVDGATSA